MMFDNAEVVNILMKCKTVIFDQHECLKKNLIVEANITTAVKNIVKEINWFVLTSTSGFNKPEQHVTNSESVPVKIKDEIETDNSDQKSKSNPRVILNVLTDTDQGGFESGVDELMSFEELNFSEESMENDSSQPKQNDNTFFKAAFLRAQDYYIETDQERPYHCQFCPKKYVWFSNLRDHIRIHTGEREYIATCKDCGMQFYKMHSFREHRRVHTGEKPFKCKYCDRGFAQQSTLRYHITTHTGERRYKCDHCELKFKSRRCVSIHMRASHTGERPYLCELCSKGFTGASGLRNHMKWHLGVRSYACQFCPRKFVAGEGLRRHMKTHTGDKPHKCPVCLKEFAERCNMRGHLKRIHKTILS